MAQGPPDMCVCVYIYVLYVYVCTYIYFESFDGALTQGTYGEVPLAAPYSDRVPVWVSFAAISCPLVPAFFAGP